MFLISGRVVRVFYKAQAKPELPSNSWFMVHGSWFMVHGSGGGRVEVKRLAAWSHQARTAIDNTIDYVRGWFALARSSLLRVCNLLNKGRLKVVASSGCTRIHRMSIRQVKYRSC